MSKAFIVQLIFHYVNVILLPYLNVFSQCTTTDFSFPVAAVVEDYRLTSSTFVDVVCANYPACIYAENY